jgi:hypothetical protein
LLVPLKEFVATVNELLVVPAEAADMLPLAGIEEPHVELLPPNLPIWLQPEGIV